MSMLSLVDSTEPEPWRKVQGDFDSKRECIRFVRRHARRGSVVPSATRSGRQAFREKYGKRKRHGRALDNCVKRAIGAR